MSEAPTSASLAPRSHISSVLRTPGTRKQQGGSEAPEPVITSIAFDGEKPESKNRLWAGLSWAADAADKAVVSSLWGEQEAPNKGKKNRGAKNHQVVGVRRSVESQPADPVGSPRDTVVRTLQKLRSGSLTLDAAFRTPESKLTGAAGNELHFSNCFDIEPEHKCVSMDLEKLPKSTASTMEASGPKPVWQDRSLLENAPCSLKDFAKKAAPLPMVDPDTRGEHQSSSSKPALRLQSPPHESERETVPDMGSRNILSDLNEASQIDQHIGLGTECASNFSTKPKWTIDQMMNQMEEADASETEPQSSNPDEEPASPTNEVTLSQVLELQAGSPDQHDDGKLEFFRQVLELQKLAEAPLDSKIVDDNVSECESIPVEMSEGHPCQKPKIISVETRSAALPKTRCRKPDRSGKGTGLAMSSAQCFVIEEESRAAGEEADKGIRGASISTALEALGSSPRKGRHPWATDLQGDTSPVMKDENVVQDWRFFAKQKINENRIYLG